MARQSVKIVKYAVVTTLLLCILSLVSASGVLTVFDGPIRVYGPVASVRDGGMAMGIRGKNDVDMRWRIQSGPAAGIMQWGDGVNAPYTSFSPHPESFGRVLYEMDAGCPVGLTLNDRTGSSISITSEDNKIVIRNETYGANFVIAIIDESGIVFPNANR